jgi:putative transposase
MPRKTKRHTTEQIIAILREAETCGKPIQDFVRGKGISEQTFYRWRNKYGGMDVKDSRRLRELEQENLRLKKLVAERDLEIEVMKEIAAKKW